MTEKTTLSPYWHWGGALSSELCDLILREGATLERMSGHVGGAVGEGGHVDVKLRNSTISWLPTNHWLEGVLYNHGLYACEQAGWGFAMGRPEPVQFTRYSPGEFYDWHSDSDVLTAAVAIRKVSVIALLNSTSEFEGGAFELKSGIVTNTVDLKRGDILAFPSLLQHRVCPVTSGERISAVCWIMGPRTL